MKTNATLIGWAILLLASTAYPQTNETEKKSQQVNTKPAMEIPVSLRKQADVVFAEGKKVFVWYYTEWKPVTFNTKLPFGTAACAYAFAPSNEVIRFTIKVTINRRNTDGSMSTIVDRVEGPENPSRIGIHNFLIHGTTKDELNNGAGQVMVKEGDAVATLTLVPFGSTTDEADDKVLSNTIHIPIKVSDQ